VHVAADRSIRCLQALIYSLVKSKASTINEARALLKAIDLAPENI
jgi:hypothetical protein